MKLNFKRILTLLLALALVLGYVPGISLTAFAAEGNPTLDTQIAGLSATYTEASAKIPGTVSWLVEKAEATDMVTINGSVLGFARTSGTKTAYLAETTSLTMTNSLETEAVLAFNYKVDVEYSKNTVTIDGASCTNEGTIEKTLQPGDNVVITLSSANNSSGSNKTSVKLTNISFGTNPDIETTFLVAENGTYSVTYGETTQEITEETKIASKATTNYTLSASPAEGYSFAGWYDVAKNVYIGAGLVSENVRFTDEEKLAVVVPLFVKTEEAIYGAGEARFTDFTAAMTYADNAVDKVVVMLMDDTLAAGSYVVPKGVTLLVPFDDLHTLYREKPGCTSSKDNNVAWETPYAFRTLTMENGAELTVKGEISIGSKHAAGGQQTAGSPTGPYGHIVMNAGSNIALESGGVLYAWGYITGEGTIVANSGAHVYENLQITDFRGGSASVAMVPTDEEDPLLKEKKVFPFSQYYVQNIEVALTLYSGAVESVYATMYALEDVYSTAIDFIGTQDSMFYIGEGSYVVKDYDPSTDRLIISAYGTGEIEVNGLSVTMAGTTLNSSMFNLPITSNITINVNGGSATINQDVALLPGSQVNIAKGASMTMGTGYNVFVYDADDWTKGYANIASGVDAENKTIYELIWTEDCNFVHSNVKLRPVSFSPSGKANRTEATLADAKVNVNGTLYVDGYLYTTNGGANITSSQGTGMIWLNADAGEQEHTNQVTQSSTDITFVNIPITAAKLLNKDGSYTETAGAEGGTGYSWDAIAGEWSDHATVYFDGNGAEGVTENAAVTYYDIFWFDNWVTLPDNGFNTPVGYKFVGWNTEKDGSGTAYNAEDDFEVTENTTLYAQWEAIIYTLTFQDENGNELTELTAQVEHGSDYTLPAVPEKTGFEGYWYVEGIGAFETGAVVVHEDMTFQAQYNAVAYDLFFDANGGCFNGDPDSTVTGAADGYEYGFVIQDLGTPGRTGYEFLGWNTKEDGSGTAPEFGVTTVTGDTIYYAQWKIATYTITWMDEDGTKLGATTVEYGSVPTFEAPTKEADAECTYTFSGWTPEVEAATENATYIATYTKVANTYTVTFTVNGETYKALDFAYGAEITAPAYETPYGHNFSGWTVPDTMPAEDITLDAALTAKTYNVEVINDQEGCIFTLSNKSATYRQAFSTVLSANVGSGIDVTMVYAGSSIIDFDFDPATGKLTVAANDVIGNIRIYAVATVLQTMDVNGGVISEYYREMLIQQGGVIEGDLITAPSPYGMTIEIEELPEGLITKTGYTHTGYTDENDNIYAFGDSFTFNQDITLTMTWKANEHTVTWIIDGVESEETVAYGTELNAPEALPKDGYTFAGWEGEIPATMPDEDITITLTSKWDINKYTVTWVDENGETVATETVEHGASATKNPAVPSKTGYSGQWESVAENVTADITIKPVYTINTYTVTWVDEDGNPVDTEIVKHGASATKNPTVPAKEGYSGEWENEATNVTGAVTINPVYTVNSYTVTWNNDGTLTTETVAYGTELNVPDDPSKEGYTFTGWEGYTEGMTMPAKNVTFTAQYTVNLYELTFYVSGAAADGETVWTQQSAMVAYDTVLADLIPATADIVVDGTKFKGVWKFSKWKDTNMWTDVAAQIPTTMPAADLVFYQDYVFTGWKFYTQGTSYLVDDDRAYKNTIAHIDGEAYLFDEEGYIVAGAGLVRHVTEEGVVEYYYFEEESYTALRNESKWIENVNDLLPVWEYAFDENGVILHHEDTSLQGIQEIEGVKYYFIDGVKAYMGLIEIDGDYYYVRSNGQLAVNCSYWISKTNGLVKEKSYQFDADGKMIVESVSAKNGIIAENGSLYYYKDGKRTYAGLIEIDGAYYYIKTSCEAVHGGIFWITKTNGLMKAGNYNFDENGKMIPMPEEEKFTGIKNGYYYKDDQLYYAGLIEIDGFYYYVNSSCKVITGQTYWISKTNGLMAEKAYTFDAEGKMVIGNHPDVKTGLYEENGKTYYYVEGVKTYAGLIEIDGYLYYVKSDCSVVKDGIYWITKTNDIVDQGRYTFDAEGRMVIE